LYASVRCSVRGGGEEDETGVGDCDAMRVRDISSHCSASACDAHVRRAECSLNGAFLLVGDERLLGHRAPSGERVVAPWIRDDRSSEAACICARQMQRA
jgi:hypothetical protein